MTDTRVITVGVQGPAGPAGAQGPAGVKGDQGDPGPLVGLDSILTQGADAGGVTITGLGAPSGAGDAATKTYADSITAASKVGFAQSLVQSTPLICKSRSTLLLGNGASARAKGTYPHQIIYDAEHGYWYLYYTGINASNIQTPCFARTTSPPDQWPTLGASAFTDLGAISGLPVPGDHCFFIRQGATWYAFVGVPASDMQLYSASSLTGPYTLANAAIVPRGTTGAFDEKQTYEPWIVRRDDGTFAMLYMGWKLDGTLEQQGLATASAITGPWTKAAGNPVIACGSAGAWDSECCADAFVLRINGVYWIFYGGCSDGSQSNDAFNTTLMLATTSDFSTFTKRGRVLRPPAHPDPAASLMWRGSMYLHTDGYIYHVYAGSNIRQTQPAFTGQAYLGVIDPVSFAKLPTDPWIVVESGDPAIVETGTGWATTSRTYFHGGSSRSSKTANDSVSFYFRGTGVRWGTALQQLCGIAQVYLDGALVATLDMNNGDTGSGTPAGTSKCYGYENTKLAHGDHVLKIVVTGTHGATATDFWVFWDYFEYLP